LPGNFSGAAVFPIQQRIYAWPFLTELDVLSYGRAVVAFGDAITDGNAGMRDANHRWPDFLAMRLQAVREQVVQRTDRLVSMGGQLGIVNRGAGGDGLAHGMPCISALARFDRDVLATAGVRYVIVQLGMDDLGMAQTLDELVSVYRQMIARARARNLRIYGATLTPFEGARHAAASAGKELLRQGANDWMRQGDEFDAVIDFDKALRDPAHHARLLPMFNSGDFLLPNDLGMQALANAIPLELFRTHGFTLGGDAV
jgi:lysophospholipase L1-like esterase